MTLSIEEVLRLYATRGAGMYGGEAVTQLEHALQCAQLAEGAGASDELVAASLLHDLGHLLTASTEGDDIHQFAAVPFLRGLFPEAVIDPIRMHVDAKRYLCYAEQGYWDALSPASKRSLELQDGVFNAKAAALFLARPHARDAVALRRWDDLAKVAGAVTRPLGHYAALLRTCALRSRSDHRLPA